MSAGSYRENVDDRMGAASFASGARAGREADSRGACLRMSGQIGRFIARHSPHAHGTNVATKFLRDYVGIDTGMGR